MTLYDIFKESVAKYPHNIAIDVPPTSQQKDRITYTYLEVDRLSDYLASNMQASITRDSIVAILLPRNSFEIYVSQLAILKCGGAYTCIDTSFPKERAQFIIKDSKAVLLITDDEYDFYEDIKIINVKELSLKRDTITRFEAPDWMSDSNLAYIIYTSGTTGNPKGVMIEHRSVCNLVLSDRDYFKLPPESRIAQTSSTSYDSSVEEIWLAFGAGATMVLANDDVVRLGPDLGEWLRGERINVLCPPPTLLRMGVCDNPETDLPDLKLLYVGGEALPKEVVDKWAPGRWLENGYGPTECSITVTRTRIKAEDPISIGRPVIGSMAYILDEQLKIVSSGQEGELCIGGISLARGYLNQPELTASKFINHPQLGRIYRTGDLVALGIDGNLYYRGRIDLQVKLRGYRIELEAIETALKKDPQVKDAACKVQETQQGQLLIAYVIPKENLTLDFSKIRSGLESKLPNYMVPSYFMTIDKMPTTQSSGKLNRKALPDYELSKIATSNKAIIMPQNEIEKTLSSEIKKLLHLNEDISIEDNFFDLGGDSLTAAMLISSLRKKPLTSMLTVRDIYDTQSIKELATLVKPVEQRTIDEEILTQGSPLVVTLIQLLWILIRVCFLGSIGFGVIFYFIPAIVNFFGLIVASVLLPLGFLLLQLIYIPLSMLFTAMLKKLLIGTYKEGEYPVWGSMYVRNWIVTQTARLVPIRSVDGTEFKNFFLRCMGVKIGRNVYFQKGANVIMGGWDLLEIGDNVTISTEASTRTVDYRFGKMIFGKIKIGDNCTLETRSTMSINSEMENNSKLTNLSMLSPGQKIPKGEIWDGVPAKFQKMNPPPPTDKVRCDTLSPIKHGVMLMLLRSAMYAFTYLHIPVIALICVWISGVNRQQIIDWFYNYNFYDDLFYYLIIWAISVPFIRLFLQAIFCRLLGKIKPGYYCRYGKKYIHMWLKDYMVEQAGNMLSGTLFWPYWLRLSGMKVGKNCEISTIINVVPELVNIEDEVFFADGIYLGGPAVDRQIVHVDQIHLSKNTFVGNHAIIPSGNRLPQDILLGICTVADENKITEGSSWFGHPCFKLPRREVMELSRDLTHNPAWYRFVTRVFWEALRFFLPIVPVLVSVHWLDTVSYYRQTLSSLQFWSYGLHLINLGYMLFMVSLIFFMKWGLLGKVRPGIHPLWSCWCSRWDFLYVAWAMYARKVLVYFEGTLMMSWWLRFMGAKVGKRVLLGGGFAQVVDPDMLNFEDYSTVLCMFQAHSFEDRILKIAPVYIRSGATVGSQAVLLYGADIGENAKVYNNSVVMKNEVLLSRHQYVGCPTRNF